MKSKWNSYWIESNCQQYKNIVINVLTVATTNNCTEGEIRLANNSTESEGRVEICVNGLWGTMCPNNTSTLDVKTICKQLGFSEYGN